MPIVNVIRGQQLPDSVFNVRTPFVRIPLWMAVTWWTVKGLARLVLLYVRFWYLTLPATLLGWLYLRYGWAGPVTIRTVSSSPAGVALTRLRIGTTTCRSKVTASRAVDMAGYQRLR